MHSTSETHTTGVDKVKMYKWELQDSPGKLQWIDKNALHVDSTYQRQIRGNKPREIASAWSWVACGALRVALRSDGTYWVIDGQHRLAAALRRSDITDLPCVVFEVSGVADEAKGFVTGNTKRGAVKIFDKHRASVLAGDVVAQQIEQILVDLGLTVTLCPTKPTDLKCLAKVQKLMIVGADHARAVLSLALRICEQDAVSPTARIVGVVDYLAKNLTCGISDNRLQSRLIEIGARKMERVMSLSVEVHGASGDKIWALGVLRELNKGLRNKFTMKGGE